VVKHRFDGFEIEMQEQRCSSGGSRHPWLIGYSKLSTPAPKRSASVRTQLNAEWNELADLTNSQRSGRHHAAARDGLQNLNSDMAAIEARLRSIWTISAKKLQRVKPEERRPWERVETKLRALWVWLSNTQTRVATEDMAKDVSEAEKLLVNHQSLKQEIEGYNEEFGQLDELWPSWSLKPASERSVRRLERSLHEMWQMKHTQLSQSLSLQVFLRDSVQCDLVLSSQENFLKQKRNANLMRELHHFPAANEEKLALVDESGQQLLAEEEHFAKEKIAQKVDSIQARREANLARAQERLDQLRGQLALQHLRQDIDDLAEWIEDRRLPTTRASAMPRTSPAATIGTKHSNEKSTLIKTLESVRRGAEQLLAERPEFLGHCPTSDRSANGSLGRFRRIYVNVWMEKLMTQMVVDEEEVVTLTDVDIWLRSIEDQEKEMEEKEKQLVDMSEHKEKLKEQHPDKEEVFEKTHLSLQQTFVKLRDPLSKKKDELVRRKRIQQLFRDIEDEKMWAEEKLALASLQDAGASLLSVTQMLATRHKVLAAEVENHRPRVRDTTRWEQLSQAMEDRRARLERSELAQQWLEDAREAETWMASRSCGPRCRSLCRNNPPAGSRARALIETEHPESERVAQAQNRLDRLYSTLKELCAEKRAWLQEQLKLYQLQREILDLESWIYERTLVAQSNELGKAMSTAYCLEKDFANSPKRLKRLAPSELRLANQFVDSLIDQGHRNSADIAEWKDRVKRGLLLTAAYAFHRFLTDCRDVLDRIEEKELAIPDDAKTPNRRTLTPGSTPHLEHDLRTPGGRGARCLNATPMTCLRGLQRRQREADSAKRRDQRRKAELADNAEFHRFLNMVRELLMWIGLLSKAEMASQEEAKGRVRRLNY
uniref:PH domain-containing protein n=1 Tax=Macrostomum lignano TaxID=282301 RepID=A0A1I8FEY4_9PLAT